MRFSRVCIELHSSAKHDRAVRYSKTSNFQLARTGQCAHRARYRLFFEFRMSPIRTEPRFSAQCPDWRYPTKILIILLS